MILIDARTLSVEMSSPISKLWKRRGVVRASTTRLGTRVRELEDTAVQPGTPNHAQQLMGKLKSLDEEFRRLHYDIVDLIEEETDDSDAEQVILDKYDDDVAALTVRLESLCATSSTPTTNARKPLSRRLSRIRAGLKRIRDRIQDAFVLMQCQEEATDFKQDLAVLYDDLVINDIDEKDDLSIEHSELEVELSQVASKIKGMLTGTPAGTHAASDVSGVRLPKLDVPTFDGNIIHWKQFWEQFTVSVHDRANLSNAEKLFICSMHSRWISKEFNGRSLSLWR